MSESTAATITLIKGSITAINNLNSTLVENDKHFSNELVNIHNN